MERNGRLWAWALVGVGLGLAACGSAMKVNQTGTAGASGTAGTAGAGGTSGAAGTTGSAGATGSAGTTGAAGTGVAGAGGSAGCNLSGRFGAPAPVDGLNSMQLDDGLSFSANGAVAWFTSTRPGGAGGRDIWTANRNTMGGFDSPTWVEMVNVAADDEVPRISDNGLTLVFGSDRNAEKGYDLMVATRSSVLASFSTPARMENVNAEDAAADSDPYVTASRKELYFASKRSGGKGDYDIYVAKADAVGTFGTPVPVLERVNTPDLEVTPVVSRNGLTLYFGRKGATSSSTYDIFVARRASTTDPFYNVEIVSELSSSTSADFPVEISEDECTLYFVSDRAGGRGDRDIYSARRGN